MTQIYRKFPEELRADNRSQRGAARRRDAFDRLTDLVVGRRGAGRHADRERFAGQHGGLIRDAHAHEIVLRVEPWRHLVAEAPEERVPRPPSLDVLADLPRLCHVPDHQVLPARILGHLARGRLGLLVVGLAVDHGREAVPRVGIDALPHVQHRAAGRVHEDTADRTQPLEVLHLYAERREDHHVVRGHGPEVEVALGPAQQNLHAHAGELGVHVGVVNDLPDEKDALGRELGAGLVRVLDRAVDSVAEAELPGQLEREVAHHELVARAANGVDHSAVVVRGERALDRALQPEAFAEVGLLHGPQSNGVVPPARTASITRWILQPSSNVAGGTVGAAPATTRTRSRTSRTKERAHIVLGVSRSHRSSGALTYSSGPPGFIISSFDSPVSTKVPSLPVTWAKCPRPQWATVVRRIVATAPPVIRIVKLANSSAVARCVMPRSSRRPLPKRAP